jgi:hypothetical protein
MSPSGTQRRVVHFDQAAVEMPGGGFNMLTPDQFLKIPLGERIRLIIDRKVQFLRDGKVVNAREALGGG